MSVGDQFDVKNNVESASLDQFLNHEIVRHFQKIGVASDLLWITIKRNRCPHPGTTTFGFSTIQEAALDHVVSGSFMAAVKY